MASTTAGVLRGVYPITFSSLSGGIAYGSGREPISYDGSATAIVVGGGTVSVEVLGGSSPSAVSGGTVKASTTGVSLRTIIGASSNLMAWSAPTVATKMDLWPPSKLSQAANEFNLGDGGFLDNTGLLATLQRGVKKAIVSMATDVVLPSSATYNV
jgi:hypothetical protein